MDNIIINANITYDNTKSLKEQSSEAQNWVSELLRQQPIALELQGESQRPIIKEFLKDNFKLKLLITYKYLADSFNAFVINNEKVEVSNV